MCEPMHSIVQFPTFETQSSRLEIGLGALHSIGHQIGPYFHLSKMGSGHSESQSWAKVKHGILPPAISYEADWPIRQTKFDGGENLIPHSLRGEALDFADTYAHRLSIGNLSILRRFLENSIAETDRPEVYLHKFREMMNVRGRKLFDPKFKQLRNLVSGFGIYRGGKFVLTDEQKQNRGTAVKVLCGLTRKRNLLIPEWSDDAKLWNAS